MGRTIVAVDALHLVHRQTLHRFRRRTRRQVFAFLTCYGVLALHPGDSLAFLVCGRESDLHPIAEVRSMNAPHVVSANKYYQYGLRFGVTFVFGIFKFDEQAGSPELVRPMTMLARLPGRP